MTIPPLIVLTALLGGCVQPGAGLRYEEDIHPILARECALCHTGSEPEGETSFVDEGLHGLLDVESAQADMLLIEAGDSLYSYLFHKLNQSQTLAGGSGTSMPQGRRLADDDLHLIRDWIDAGAAP